MFQNPGFLTLKVDGTVPASHVFMKSPLPKIPNFGCLTIVATHHLSVVHLIQSHPPQENKLKNPLQQNSITPLKVNYLEPKNHPIEKENHFPSTSGFKMWIFNCVYYSEPVCRLQPSKRRPFTIKKGVIWVPGWFLPTLQDGFHQRNAALSRSPPPYAAAPVVARLRQRPPNEPMDDVGLGGGRVDGHPTFKGLYTDL